MTDFRVQATLEGDARQWEDAVEKSRRALGRLTDEAKGVDGALAKTGRTQEWVQRELGKTTDGAQKTERAASNLRERFDHLDDRATRVQTAISGLSSALGFSGTRVADLAGGVADLAMNLARGGLLLAGLSALGVAVAFATGHIVEQTQAAEEASRVIQEKYVAALDEARKAADDAARSVRDFGKTATESQIANLRREIAAMQGASSSGMGMHGDLNVATSAPTTTLREMAGLNLDIAAASELALRANEGAIVVREKENAILVEKRRQLAELLKLQQMETKEAERTARVRIADRAAASGLDHAMLANQSQLLLGGSYNQVAGLRLSMGGLPSGAAASVQRGSEMAEAERSLREFRQGLDLSTLNLQESAQTSIEARLAMQELAKVQARRAEEERKAIGLGLVDMLAAAVNGQGFTAAGAQLGGMAGGAIGSLFGPAGGAIGSALGTLLGTVLGSVIDELVNVLGVLTPLFDALAVIVAAFAPVFQVIGYFFQRIGGHFELLALIIQPLAEVFASLLLIVVRVAEMQLAGQSALLLFVASVVVFAEVLTGWLEVVDAAMVSVVMVVYSVQNAFVDLYNGVVNFLKVLAPFIGVDPSGIGLGGVEKVFSPSVGGVIDGFATTMDELRNMGQDQTSAVRDNTDAVREFTRTATNIPAWYRVALAEYRSEGPRSGGGGGGGVNVGTLNMTARTSSIARAIENENVRRFGGMYAQPRQRRNTGN